jgi:hypothetical protein
MKKLHFPLPKRTTPKAQRDGRRTSLCTHRNDAASGSSQSILGAHATPNNPALPGYMSNVDQEQARLQ